MTRLEQVEQWLGPALAEVAGVDACAETFIQCIVRGSGLLVEREQGKFEFSHKSFQEYLAAVEIKETKQVELLVSHFGEVWWEDTIRLYAAQSDTGPLLQAGLDDPSAAKLTLACDCMEEGLRTPISLRERLEQTLDLALHSEDSDKSRIAAEVKLARRTRSMIRLHESVRIDNGLVSCAEYQLFVNEIPQYALPYWHALPIAQSRSRAPVTGVWPEAAVAFCNWLTDRDQLKRQFRLPAYTECNALESVHKEGQQEIVAGIGYWCTASDDGVHLAGVAPEQLNRYTRTSSRSLIKQELPRQVCFGRLPIPAPSRLASEALAVDIAGPEVWPALDYCGAWLRIACHHSDSASSAKLLGSLTLVRLLGHIRLIWFNVAPDDRLAHALEVALGLALALDRVVALDLALILGVDLDTGDTRDLARTEPHELANGLNAVRVQTRNGASLLARDLANARVLAAKRANARIRRLAVAQHDDLAESLSRASEHADDLLAHNLMDHDLGLVYDRILARKYEVAYTLAYKRAHKRPLARDNEDPDPEVCEELEDMAEWTSARRARTGPECLAETIPGTSLPITILRSLLSRSFRDSLNSKWLFESALADSDIRDALGKSRADCGLAAEYYGKRAERLGALFAYAALYAVCDEHGTSPWGGLRIVSESPSAFELGSVRG